MSVKTIFKVLLGTIVIIVSSFVIIELFNISVVSLQIRHAQDTAMRQSCELFTQETYKQLSDSKSASGKAGSTYLPEIEDYEGNLYVGGEGIYGTGTYTVDAIYKELYTKSNSNFRRAINDSDSRVKGFSKLINSYRNLDLLYLGILNNGNLPKTTVNWSSSAALLQKNIDAEQANSFYKKYYTPANLGIPYLDPDCIDRIYKWNLTKLLSENNPDNIKRWDPDHYNDPSSEDKSLPVGIYYKGFMIYPTLTTRNVKEIRYHAYNMSGKTYTFMDVGQINPTSILNPSMTTISITGPKNHLTSDTGLKFTNSPDGNGIYLGADSNLETTYNGVPIPDNKVVTTVSVKYTTAVSYVGITPLKSLFAYIWNTQVDGIGGTSGNTGNVEDINPEIQMMGNDTNDTEVSVGDSGKSWGGTGMVPTTGDITFWLVK